MNDKLIYGRPNHSVVAMAERFSEGFESPEGKVIYVMPPGGGKSVVLDALREQFKGMEIVMVGHDELNNMTAGEKDVLILDSVGNIDELWDMKIEPTRSVMMHGQSLGRAIARKIMRDTIESITLDVVDKLPREKPYLAMNDYRNNRNGRKNR